jgi:hypothetical protein
LRRPLLTLAAFLAVVPAASAGVAADAARSFERGFFVASPGGVVASAARVVGWHRLAVRATRGSHISPNLLEAMIFVESSGRPRVVGFGGRRGLTQVSTRRLPPLAQLRATVRRLERARRVLGRVDLAVASYHLGVRRLAHARSYASFYFRSGLQGTRADYYWKVLAAERVLGLYRHHRRALVYEQLLQLKKSSAEEVLHPRRSTVQFRTPAAIVRARQRRILLPVPHDWRRTHIRIGRQLGELAPRLGRRRMLYAALRPQALDVLLYLGRCVHRPLVLTSAVRDKRYQRVLTHFNAVATHAYSVHTTGFAFDILRTPRIVSALNSLAAVNAIAYITELGAFHVAVASDAPRKLALLRSLAR